MFYFNISLYDLRQTPPSAPTAAGTQGGAFFDLSLLEGGLV